MIYHEHLDYHSVMPLIGFLFALRSGAHRRRTRRHSRRIAARVVQRKGGQRTVGASVAKAVLMSKRWD